jgi:hypothetical protein
MSPEEAIDFVRTHGVVLLAARGPVPTLTYVVAGGPFRGSWCSHPRGREMYRAAEAVGGNPEILTCRLVQGKVTFLHRRLWPALVRLGATLPPERTCAMREEHTASGAHHTIETPFPSWVPADVHRAAADLSEEEAYRLLGDALTTTPSRGLRSRRQGSPKRGRRR